jgi:hypothetical protein
MFIAFSFMSRLFFFDFLIILVDSMPPKAKHVKPPLPNSSPGDGSDQDTWENRKKSVPKEYRDLSSAPRAAASSADASKKVVVNRHGISRVAWTPEDSGGHNGSNVALIRADLIATMQQFGHTGSMKSFAQKISGPNRIKSKFWDVDEIGDEASTPCAKKAKRASSHSVPRSLIAETDAQPLSGTQNAQMSEVVGLLAPKLDWLATRQMQFESWFASSLSGYPPPSSVSRPGVTASVQYPFSPYPFLGQSVPPSLTQPAAYPPPQPAGIVPQVGNPRNENDPAPRYHSDASSDVSSESGIEQDDERAHNDPMSRLPKGMVTASMLIDFMLGEASGLDSLEDLAHDSLFTVRVVRNSAVEKKLYDFCNALAFLCSTVAGGEITAQKMSWSRMKTEFLDDADRAVLRSARDSNRHLCSILAIKKLAKANKTAH